jgi:hypothetical protein
MAALRWNRVRQAQGRPLLHVPEVRVRVQTSRAIFVRECRDLARRRAAYDGVGYRDHMAWDPIVVRQVCEKLGIRYRGSA